MQKQKIVLNSKANSLKYSLEYSANTPLWQRVPTKSVAGEYLWDFMIIFPGLKNAPKMQKRDIVNKITDILNHYADTVVFADLNMKINLLWVSIKPEKGMIVEIPTALLASIPNAKLVSERPPKM